MLSMHRPLPSMLIMTLCRFRVAVKSSLVNWADSTDRRNAIFVGLSGTPETDPTLPHCDTRRVHFDRRVSPEARDLASLFSTMLGPNLDKHSAVLGLVQDEPALRAGAASGSLDKTCARRSAGGRSAPRNGPLSLTKECNLDLGSGEAASEAMETRNTVSSERRLTWPILAIGQAPLPAFAKPASFGALC